MNAGEKKALTETLDKGKTALVASQASFAGASIFLGKALEKLWKSLAVLQMLNHLALMDIPLPPNYLTYMESMNEMNTKNLYAANYLFEGRITKEEMEGSYNTKFEMMGYKGLNTIVLGATLIQNLLV
jgi:hypothetical protein